MSTTISERIPNSVGLSGRLEAATTALAALATLAILFSIAAAQIFLGAALLTLLLSRRPIRFPSRLGAALLAFLAWNLLSLAFSPDVWAGIPQLRKLFIFLAFLVAYNAYTEQRQIGKTIQGVVLGGAAAALYGLAQFVQAYWRVTSDGLPFYENYLVVHQITGFMSHWLTFGGQLMMVLLLAVSAALFGKLSPGMRWAAWLSGGLAALGLLAAFTRGVWMGAFAGLAYLLLRFKPRTLWLLPAAALLLYFLSPFWLQRRALSIFDTGADSSNQSRVVMFWTGLNMIAANPLLGVGPERVEAEFLRYKPAAIPLPDAWYGHLHNNYLQLAAERGIPSLLFWLWVLFEVFRSSLILARSPVADARMLGQAGVAMSIGLMVAGLFEFNLGDSEVMMLYLFLIAAGYAWTRLESLGPNGTRETSGTPGTRDTRDTKDRGDAAPGPSALPQAP